MSPQIGQGFDWSLGKQNHNVSRGSNTDMMTNLPWERGGDIILQRVPTGGFTSQGQQNSSIACNVAWSVFAGSIGYEWGYGGSGPHELAMNILNQFVPPGTDGFKPCKVDTPWWGERSQTFASKTAVCLVGEFKATFLEKLPLQGGVIEGQVIQEWLNSRAEQVRTAYYEPGN